MSPPVVRKEVLGRVNRATRRLKSSELTLTSRSCAARPPLSKKVLASVPGPSLASTRRPRLSMFIVLREGMSKI